MKDGGFLELELKIQELSKLINEYDNIVVGAGAGLSASAGLTYSGARFEVNFSDYIDKYKFSDMYSAGFYPFKTLEERWGYWCKHIFFNRYKLNEAEVYQNLLKLVGDKNYFVITTNVDHMFQKNGFDKSRLFYTQGDYGLWQCSTSCHKKTYDNKEQVYKMLESLSNLKIPSELIPCCPVCGKPMSMNLRADNSFVEDEGWHDAMRRYERYLENYADEKTLFLDLGIGGNTPSIIKYPFWQMTYKNKDARYVCINLGEAVSPNEIKNQSICIDFDITEVLKKII